MLETPLACKNCDICKRRICSETVLPVVSKMVLSSEGLLANITGIRPLIRVGPLMNEEVVGFGEMPATEFANKFLFSLGWESAAGGFSVRGQLAELGDGSS